MKRSTGEQAKRARTVGAGKARTTPGGDLSGVLGVDMPIVMVDSKSRIRWFTPAAEALLELDKGDIGRRAGKALAAANVPDLGELIPAASQGSGAARCEAQGADGRWYSVRFLPFPAGGRKAGGVLITFTDIHGLKQVQQRLEREQKLSSAILDAAENLLVIVLDREGRIAQFNRGCEAATGYALAEVKGRRLWDCLPVPEERSRVRQAFREARNGGRRRGEMHWRTKRGQVRAFAWSSRTVEGEAGNVDFVVLAGSDVTRQESAEEDARESASTTRAVLETAPEAFLAHDAGGRIVLVNAAAEEMYGYGREEMIGRPLSMLVPRRFRARHAAHVARFLKQPGRRPMGAGLDFVGLRKDGSEFPVAVGLSYLETRNGPLAVSFVSDLTERRRNEAALQALTARLIGIQESGNKGLARELHDVLSQKLAALGMEISSLAQTAGSVPAALPERCRALSRRVNALADEVHALSRRLHPAILDELGLEAALREECEGFSTQTGVPVRIRSRDVPASIREDVKVCLYRVAQEALRNIAKHASAETVRVSLRGGQNRLLLRVEDAGDGFDRYEAGRKGGLGLVSMEERVRLVKGRLTIRSKPGEGTLVEVSVPLEKDEALEDTAG